MQYFLDSAKTDEIAYAYENWAISGVTTNPKHILNSGKPFFTVIQEIARMFEGKDFPISVEINPHLSTRKEIAAQAKEIASISKNFVIKIPCFEQGLAAACELEQAGVPTNVTLVFSPSQALQAARAGAKFVSPFIGWKEASGEDCSDYLSAVGALYRQQNARTKIIAAALRSGKHIVEAALAGADIATCSFDVYKESFSHPFTDYGLKRFQAAWDATDTQSGKP